MTRRIQIHPTFGPKQLFELVRTEVEAARGQGRK
jgi:hypothetical protein